MGAVGRSRVLACVRRHDNGYRAETSVVDKHSLAHDTPQLAIIGGSTFVNTTGYNPTETMQALAWMGAEHIAENFESLAA